MTKQKLQNIEFTDPRFELLSLSGIEFIGMSKYCFFCQYLILLLFYFYALTA